MNKKIDSHYDGRLLKWFILGALLLVGGLGLGNALAEGNSKRTLESHIVQCADLNQDNNVTLDERIKYLTGVFQGQSYNGWPIFVDSVGTVCCKSPNGRIVPVQYSYALMLQEIYGNETK